MTMYALKSATLSGETTESHHQLGSSASQSPAAEESRTSSREKDFFFYLKLVENKPERSQAL